MNLGIYIGKEIEISYMIRGKIKTIYLGEVDSDFKLKLFKARRILEKNFKQYKFGCYLVLNDSDEKDWKYKLLKIFNFAGIEVVKIFFKNNIDKTEDIGYSEWAILNYENSNGLKEIEEN